MEMQMTRLRETVGKFNIEAEELKLKAQGDQEKQRKLLISWEILKLSLQVNVSQMTNLLENKLLKQ